MSSKKCNASASPKRKSSKKQATSGKVATSQKPDDNSKKPKKARSRRSSSPDAGHVQNHREKQSDTTGKQVNIFLAREGVAFGPYTEFQVLESVRLGIFESNDFALPEDSQEWLEISQVLPMSAMSREQLPVTSPAIDDCEGWVDVSELFLPVKAQKQKQQQDKPHFKPLTEQQLREHEMLSAPSPATAFLAELICGRFAFAAIPLGVIILGLLTSAAVLKHHEPSTFGQGHPRPLLHTSFVGAAGQADSALTRVLVPALSVLPSDATASTSGKLTASTQIPDLTSEQQARGGQAP